MRWSGPQQWEAARGVGRIYRKGEQSSESRARKRPENFDHVGIEAWGIVEDKVEGSAFRPYSFSTSCTRCGSQH